MLSGITKTDKMHLFDDQNLNHLFDYINGLVNKDKRMLLKPKRKKLN